MLDDTVKIAEKAKASGVSVQQTTYPGMFHVFQMLFPELLTQMLHGMKLKDL